VAQHAVSNDLGRGGHGRNDSTTRVRLLPTDILRQAPLDQAADERRRQAMSRLDPAAAWEAAG
jgi:hypothetical protein